ncbi:MAG: metallophosphoesterase [Candidatus Sumerlaeia bacterium]
MSLFIIAYFIVLSAMYGFMVWRLHAAWPDYRWPWIALAAWSIFMIFAPILSRFLMRDGGFQISRALYVTGFTWFIIGFWFLVMGILLLAWNGALTGLGHWLGDRADKFIVPPRVQFPAIFAIIILLCAYGLYEASTLRVTRLIIETDSLPAGRDSARIVFISDVHIGAVMPVGRIENIVEAIRAENPDLLVSGGDLLDFHPDRLQAELAMLQSVDPPLGKFAVTGNHEFYGHSAESLQFHRDAGFRLLRGESVLVDGWLRVGGVDDPAAKMEGANPKAQEKKLAGENFPGEQSFYLFLKHQPIVTPGMQERFNLQLSGHIHGGQVYPFRYMVAMVYRYMTGRHELAPGRTLFVTRGTGTWGTPLRVLAPPELTIIDLVRPKP